MEQHFGGLGPLKSKFLSSENPDAKLLFSLEFNAYAYLMKFLFILLIVTSGVFAQNFQHCSKPQITNTKKVSKKICTEHINEFALRSSVLCHIKKLDIGLCQAECREADKKSFASLRVEFTPDCGREVAYYKKMGIRYSR